MSERFSLCGFASGSAMGRPVLLRLVGLNVQRKSRLSGDKAGSHLLVPEPALKRLEKNGEGRDDSSRNDDRLD